MITRAKRLALFLTVLAMVAVLAFVAYRSEAPPPAGPFSQHTVPRSGKWPKVRAAYLAEHPDCQACGRTAKQSGPIEVHHVEPFHDDPSKELDPQNLIALCRRCHELLGHLDKWSSFNSGVREDADRMLRKIKNRP